MSASAEVSLTPELARRLLEMVPDDTTTHKFVGRVPAAAIAGDDLLVTVWDDTHATVATRVPGESWGAPVELVVAP